MKLCGQYNVIYDPCREKCYCFRNNDFGIWCRIFIRRSASELTISACCVANSECLASLQRVRSACNSIQNYSQFACYGHAKSVGHFLIFCFYFSPESASVLKQQWEQSMRSFSSWNYSFARKTPLPQKHTCWCIFFMSQKIAQLIRSVQLQVLHYRASSRDGDEFVSTVLAMLSRYVSFKN